jgi:mRNA interferase RelE/StbE
LRLTAHHRKKVAPHRRIRTQSLSRLGCDQPALTSPHHSSRTYRVRTGDYRIMYEVHDGRVLVLVIRIGHRREVYRGL